MAIHVFGIRHHGPGCARSLRQALDTLSPDIVLIEGPPDANSLLPLAADAAMRPPVALLVYRSEPPKPSTAEHPSDAQRAARRHWAVFYPFAEFSPEWQAIRFALERGIAVRFMDLPMSLRFAMPKSE